MKMHIAVLFSLLTLVTALSSSADDQKTALEGKVRAFLDGKYFFEAADRAMSFHHADDFSFYNIDRNRISRLVGEDFTDNVVQQSLLADPWKYELGESSNWIYSIDYESERFVLRHKNRLFQDGLTNRKVTDEEIKEIALRDLRTLGLADVNNLEIDVRQLMRATKYEGGQTEHQELAHKAFVFRKVGDIRVQGARAVLSYCLDGSMQKVLLKWPSLEKRSSLLQRTKGNDEIVAAVAREMEANGMSQAQNIDVRVGIIIADGTLRLAAVVTAELNGPNETVFLKEIEVEI